MGRNQKFKKSKSLEFASESFAEGLGRIQFLFFLAVIAISPVGCNHVEKKKEVLSAKELFGADARQITFAGNNDSPRFSKDGTRLLYQKSQVPGLRGQQIFEQDLINSIDRRVTYSDGDAFGAIYLNEKEILYSSTTDEIKENPLAKKPEGIKKQGSEIYQSDLFGNNIVRWTQWPGFDGEVSLFSSLPKSTVVFTSYRQDQFGIYKFDSKSNVTTVIASDPATIKRFPTVSPDRHSLAWVEVDVKTNQNRLILYRFKEKSITVLKSGEGVYESLSFAPRVPERLVYGIERTGDKASRIELYDLGSKCTRVVVKDAESLGSPVISDETTERVAFTRQAEGKKQIYVLKVPTDLGPCLESVAQVKIKE